MDRFFCFLAEDSQKTALVTPILGALAPQTWHFRKTGELPDGTSQDGWWIPWWSLERPVFSLGQGVGPLPYKWLIKWLLNGGGVVLLITIDNYLLSGMILQVEGSSVVLVTAKKHSKKKTSEGWVLRFFLDALPTSRKNLGRWQLQPPPPEHPGKKHNCQLQEVWLDLSCGFNDVIFLPLPGNSLSPFLGGLSDPFRG